MPKQKTLPNIEKRLTDAALRLLERTRWSELTLAAALRSAKLSWNAAFGIAPSKLSLVGLVLRQLAEETARTYRPERSSQSARERMFDVCMTWFDVQQKRKKPLHALYGGLRAEPLTLLSARGAVRETAERLLALAEADAGPLAPARAACLAGILAHATMAWLEDDNEMSRTMARLDGDLRRVESFLWPKSSRSKSPRKK